jgi:hypothetical protein
MTGFAACRAMACSRIERPGRGEQQGGTTAGRLFKSGSEKPVHGDKRTVAESGAWCNDLGCRWHKGELR